MLQDAACLLYLFAKPVLQMAQIGLQASLV